MEKFSFGSAWPLNINLSRFPYHVQNFSYPTDKYTEFKIRGGRYVTNYIFYPKALILNLEDLKACTVLWGR